MVIGALSVTFTYLFVPLWIFAYIGRLLRTYETPVYMRVPSQGWKPAFGLDGIGGAVASEVDICSSSGAYVLKRGGSAVDGVSLKLTRQLLPHCVLAWSMPSIQVSAVAAFHW